MSASERSTQHMPFFEALAGMDEFNQEWKSLSAGLVTLRLFDQWAELDSRGGKLDQWSISAVREAILEIETQHRVKAILSSIVDAIAQRASVSFAVIAPRLMAYGHLLQFDAKWTLAADVYRTVLSHASVEHDCDTLIAANRKLGICLRTLAEWTEASAAFAAVEQLSTMVGDTAGAIRARISEGKISMMRGNFPRADEILRTAVASAAEHSLPDVRTMAIRELSFVARRLGKMDEAIRLGYEAVKATSESSDRDHAMADLAAAFVEIGVRSAARDLYVVLVATSSDQYVRWLSTINLIEIAAADGFEPVFEQHRRELVPAPLPPALAAMYHLYVGQGYCLFAKPEAAIQSLERAIEIAERHQVFDVLINAERMLKEIRDGGVIIVAEVGEADQEVGEIAEVAHAVRAMRELVGA